MTSLKGKWKKIDKNSYIIYTNFIPIAKGIDYVVMLGELGKEQKFEVLKQEYSVPRRNYHNI